MTFIQQVAFNGAGFGSGTLYTGTVVVSGGSGSLPFPSLISGTVYHRQVSPPGGAGQYSYYVQSSIMLNGTNLIHDVHTTTGYSDISDCAKYINEQAFYIVNANGDGNYFVALWVGA